MSTAKRIRPAPGRRLAPDTRRQEIVDAAALLISARGAQAVQLATVAREAGITRQLVYRYFRNREALIAAVLEDFADDLARRFGHGAARALPTSLEDATRVFVEAVCDTIAAKGAGAWMLLDGHGPDPELARLGRALQEQVVAPWRAQIAATTGMRRQEVAVVTPMIVAAGRAALAAWYTGRLGRDAAVRYATRGVSALLAAFTSR